MQQDERHTHSTQADRPGGEAHEPRRLRKQRIFFALLLLVSAAGALAVGRNPVAAAPLTPPDGYAAKSSGPVHFSGRLDRQSVLAGSDGEVKIEVVIAADASEAGLLPRLVPTDVIVVLDRSGSMSGQPIHFARAAVRQLIQELGPGDRFALVSYSSDARLEIPLAIADAAARSRWLAAVNRVSSAGGTNMSSGLDMAAATLREQRQLGRSARVILISDGHANEGDSSRPGLTRRAAAAVKGEWVLSTVGVGQGFDEGLMTTLASTGTGNFYYIQRGDELGEIFADEFAAARETVASGLELHVDAGAGVQLTSAGGYSIERAGSRYIVRPGSLFAGQERRLWLSLRTPTSEPGALSLGNITLHYGRIDGRRESLAFDGPLELTCVKGEADYLASIDRDAWEQSVLVEDYNALKLDVAADMRRGERKQAKDRIRGYRAKQQKMNDHVKSMAVARQIDELETLAGKIEESASAAPAATNLYIKKLSAEGFDGRRVGAKR